MARPNKVEQHKLQKLIATALSQGKSTRQIAADCSRAAGESISHVAIARYIETIDKGKKKLEVVKDASRVANIVNFDIDIIQMQYRTTTALLERFEFVDNLPRMFEERMNEMAGGLKEDADPDYLHRWKIGFVDELRRNIQSIALLNRELRENSKFMAELREKAFEFNLIQEYLYLFMEVFRKSEVAQYGKSEAFELANQQIAANPRMQRIVEQQQQLRGGDLE